MTRSRAAKWRRSPFLRAFRTILDHPADRILIAAHALRIAWLREGVRASVGGATDLGIALVGVVVVAGYGWTSGDTVARFGIVVAGVMILVVALLIWLSDS